MKILTAPILTAFAKQGYTGNKETKDIKVVMKMFNPAGAGTFYLYEKLDDDTYMAYVNLGDPTYAELGAVSLTELEEYRGRMGLGIERDMHFPIGKYTVREVMDKVKAGGHV